MLPNHSLVLEPRASAKGDGAGRQIEAVVRRDEAQVTGVGSGDITPRAVDAADVLADRVTSVGLARVSWDLVRELWAQWRREQSETDDIARLGRRG
jgi:hypothetical protein